MQITSNNALLECCDWSEILIYNYAADFEGLKDKSQNNPARMKYAEATSQWSRPWIDHGR
jgi:hypothetical protein